MYFFSKKKNAVFFSWILENALLDINELSKQTVLMVALCCIVFWPDSDNRGCLREASTGREQVGGGGPKLKLGKMKSIINLIIPEL